jgi:hypothetical protein
MYGFYSALTRFLRWLLIEKSQWWGWAAFLLATLPIYFTYKVGWYADIMYFDSLVTDLFRDGGNWLTWRFQPSPSYMPDFFLYALAWFLFDYSVDRVFFVSYLQAICIAASSLWLLRETRTQRAANIGTLILLLMVVVSYSSYTTNMMMYFNSTNGLISPLILSMVSLAFIVRIVKNSHYADYLWLGVTVFSATISSVLYVVTFLATALACALLFALGCLIWGKYQKSFARSFAHIAGVLTASGSFGLLASPAITYNQAVETRLATILDRSAIATSIHVFIDASWDILLSKNWFFYLLIGAWLLGTLIAIGRWLVNFVVSIDRIWHGEGRFSPQLSSRHQHAVQIAFSFICLLSLVLIPVNLLAVFLSGAMNIWGYRYFSFEIFLGMFIFLLFLNNHVAWITLWLLPRTIPAVSAIMVLIFFATHFEAVKPRKLSVSEVRNHVGTFEKNASDCLDSFQEKFALRDGITHYLLARPIYLLSKKGLRVHQFNPDLSPYFWMNNFSWYTKSAQDKSKAPFYNFILVDTPHEEPSVQAIQSLVGPASRIFLCPEVPMKVLVYDDDRLDRLAQEKIAAMLQANPHLHKLLAPGPGLYGQR